MTSSQIWLILVINIWMISIYSDNISKAQTSRQEYSTNFRTKDFCLCRQMWFHITSLWIPWIYLSLEGSPWPVQSPNYPRLANPQKVRTFNPSSAANFYHLHLRILRNDSSAHMSYPQGYPCISPMSAILPLKHLRRLSPQLPSLPLDPDTQITVETDTPTTHLLLSFHYNPMANCTPLHPLLDFSAPELNYDVHDKELLAIFEASNDVTLSRRLGLQLTWSLITRICNTFHDKTHALTSTLVWYLSGSIL